MNAIVLVSFVPVLNSSHWKEFLVINNGVDVTDDDSDTDKTNIQIVQK